MTVFIQLDAGDLGRCEGLRRVQVAGPPVDRQPVGRLDIRPGGLDRPVWQDPGHSAADVVANPGAQNVPGGASLVTVPTGACQTPPAGGSCPQTFGGNIAVISAHVSGGNLHWNGVVFPQGLTYCNAAANALCNIAAVDPNLKNPYQVNYNLGV